MTDTHPPAPAFVSLPQRLILADRVGGFLCRVSNRFRMKYSVATGLHALGTPAPDSPVLVTANFRLTLNVLRSALADRDVWILAVDTKGINVWCAAGKGSFGTGSIVHEINSSQLRKIVTTTTLILPQLGASGVNASKLQKESGFSVKFGPVRAADIPAYLDAGCIATKEMRQVHFPLVDRLKLIPMEAIPATKILMIFLLAAATLFGITKTGILFRPALTGVFPLAIAGFTAVFTGSVLVPALLPFIPFRAFTLKGVVLGCAGAVTLVTTLPVFRTNLFLTAFCLVAVPALSSFCAFLFTGSTTYTSPSGVKAELKKAWPLFITGAVTSTLLFVATLITFRRLP